MNYNFVSISLFSFTSSNVQLLIDKTTVNDDTNWLFDSNFDTNYYQVSETITDDTFIYEEEGDGYINNMLLIQIFPSDTSTLIKRKYTKIYDIVALLSGLINIVHFVIGVIRYYINLLSQKLFLFRMTFHTNIRNTWDYNSSVSINNSTNKLNTIIKGKELSETTAASMTFNNFMSSNKSLSVIHRTSFETSNNKIQKLSLSSLNNKQILINTLFCCSYSSKSRYMFSKYGYKFIKQRYDVSSKQIV